MHLRVELEVQVWPVEVAEGLGLDLGDGELLELDQEGDPGGPDLKGGRGVLGDAAALARALVVHLKQYEVSKTCLSTMPQLPELTSKSLPVRFTAALKHPALISCLSPFWSWVTDSAVRTFLFWASDSPL